MMRFAVSFLGAAAFCLVPAAGVTAEPTRVPVLAGVKHPHTYYWRELYMPQLTTGPSSVAFSPDGKSVVYSMAGSLWMQEIGSDTAREITAGPGYDYQPDWSPDGRHVVFTRQKGNALNLVLLNLKDGSERQLTSGDGASLEPRFSPDGRKLAYISTKDSGYLGLYVADISEKGLMADHALVAGNVTETYRYYYSQADHVINPSWSPDGKRIYCVTNPEVAWGTGHVYSVAVDNPDDRIQLTSEETSWAARPEGAPDGKRVLYSSYSGRQWHQLWLTTVKGDYPLPLTFGDFDISGARWSPDAQHLAYISNEDGGLALWYHTVLGGARQKIEAAKRIYKRPMTTLDLALKDDAGSPLAGRVMVLASDGRHYAPEGVRMHADDYMDAAKTDHENHYFHCAGSCRVQVPEGSVSVMASHGFGHKIAYATVDAGKASGTVPLTLAANPLPEKFGSFTSADMHVHMNYGGKYKQTTETMAADAKAEDLDIIYNLIVNKEERIPDISQFKTERENHDGVTVYEGQEYHTSYWGHLGFLHLNDHLVTPDFSSYWHTGIASPYPTNRAVIDLAHEQGAVAGYVHPFDDLPDPTAAGKLTHSLPVDAALGRADYLEIVSFADHQNTAAVWYKLLNLGFKVMAGAGTDAMTNYASLRGPIGLNRIFLDDVAASDPASLVTAIKVGRSFVSNGPQIGMLVSGVKPGSTIIVPARGAKVRVQAALRSSVPVERFEIVMNGVVVESVPVGADGMTADVDASVAVDGSGWLLVRAVAETSHPFVQDVYTYATTNPVWLEVSGKPQHAPEDARYFLKWLDRMEEHAAARTDYNFDWERDSVLGDISAARKIFEAKAN